MSRYNCCVCVCSFCEKKLIFLTFIIYLQKDKKKILIEGLRLYTKFQTILFFFSPHITHFKNQQSKKKKK